MYFNTNKHDLSNPRQIFSTTHVRTQKKKKKKSNPRANIQALIELAFLNIRPTPIHPDPSIRGSLRC